MTLRVSERCPTVTDSDEPEASPPPALDSISAIFASTLGIKPASAVHCSRRSEMPFFPGSHADSFS